MDGPAPGRTCPRCSASMPQDAAFCPRCGAPQTMGEEDIARQYSYYAPPPVFYVQKSSLENAMDIGRGIGAIMTVAILALVAVNMGIMLWGIGLVIPEALETYTSLFLALPWLWTFLQLHGWAFVAYYLLLIAAVLLSYVYMLFKGRREMIRELTFKPTAHSPAYVISTLFMAVLTMNTAYILFLGLIGIDPSSGGVSGELWAMLYSLLRASVWEEVICRILYIGLPLGVVYALKGQRGNYHRYLLGGGFSFGPWEKAFLIFSSAMFALAHVFSWDLYKVPPTFVAGLALGYLFLKYGVYASIMLHFFIDYLSMPLQVWTGDAAAGALGLFILAIMAVGSVYLLYYTVRAAELFSGRRMVRWEGRRPSNAFYRPVPQSAYRPYDGPMTSPSFGYICRHCGWTEARYVDGQFICSRCGGRN